MEKRQRLNLSTVSASGDDSVFSPTPPKHQQRFLVPTPAVPAQERIQVSRRLYSSESDEEPDDNTFTLLNQQTKYYGSNLPLNFIFKFIDCVWNSIITGLKDEVNDLSTDVTFPMTPYTEEKVRRTAITSRLIVVIIQILACLTLPAHVNDGFKTPAIDPVSSGLLDSAVNTTFGGFINWDGQYFLHVAIRGYTHENTMAFFPLFPVTVGILAKMVHLLMSPLVSIHSLTIALGVIFNAWCFQNAAVTLSELVALSMGAKATSILPTVILLFCYNPASIFFTAFYSESLFAWLTFSCILELYKRNLEKSIFYAALGSCCRSNGLLNFGLIGIAALAQIAGEVHTPEQPQGKFLFQEKRWKRYVEAVKKSVRVGVMCLVGVSPFFCFQAYCIAQFCSDRQSTNVPSFCLDESFSLPYSYIQKANWDVGFLRYFELKQIPNFMLAAPVLVTMGTMARYQAKKQKLQVLEQLRTGQEFYTEVLELALAWHGLFLTFLCLFCIHVQVSTRMILSTCPVIYLYIAQTLSDERSLFLRRLKSWTPRTFMIQMWFSLYFLAGTVGFSLGYPWT